VDGPLPTVIIGRLHPATTNVRDGRKNKATRGSRDRPKEAVRRFPRIGKIKPWNLYEGGRTTRAGNESLLAAWGGNVSVAIAQENHSNWGDEPERKKRGLKWSMRNQSRISPRDQRLGDGHGPLKNFPM